MSAVHQRILLSLVALLLSGRITTADQLSRPAIAKLAKPATALVDARPAGVATAFCIDASGLFITNEHVVHRTAKGGTVTLVFDAGMASQRKVNAKVVRSDKSLDLALLQTQEGNGFPFLELGSDPEIAELDELIAFGFPFGTALSPDGDYPAISINMLSVSSLRRDKRNGLERIQLDSSLNPGNSGGPVVDQNGKVVGVVVSGIVGAGINHAIPSGYVRAFLNRPVITFTPPTIKPAKRHELAEFRATAKSFVPGAKPISLDLVLSAVGGPDRRMKMEQFDGQYRTQAVPFPATEDEFGFRTEIKFSEGLVTGPTKEQIIKIGSETVKLSEVRSLVNGETVLVSGERLMGDSNLESVTFRLGTQQVTIFVDRAAEIRNVPDDADGCLHCTLIGSSDGQEIGRFEQIIYAEGVRHASLESIKNDEFIKPPNVSTPSTYLKAISTVGDFIGQGKTFDYGGADLNVKGNNAVITVSVDGWEIAFAAPRGKVMQPGEFPNAKRFPFNEESPGLDFSGHGRGSNIVGGKYVIWELEKKGDNIEKLAVDFIYRSEGSGPPLYGMLRFNSSFE